VLSEERTAERVLALCKAGKASPLSEAYVSGLTEDGRKPMTGSEAVAHARMSLRRSSSASRCY